MERYAECPVRKPGDTLLPEVVSQLPIYGCHSQVA